ncbi:MAG: alpha/beta hydrolase [Aureliella sp.]
MQRFLATIMLIAAVASAVLAPLAEFYKPKRPQGINQLLFFPARYPSGDWAPQDLDYEDVYFPAADNTRLHGWYCRCPQARATVLFLHGNAGNVASRASMLRWLQSWVKVDVFIFDYRGFGRSAGMPTIDGALQDARAARAKLRELAGIDNSQMMLMGESLGGAIAVQLAAESAPQALVLQSTFSSLRDLADVHYPQHSSVVPPTLLSSVSEIAKFHGPLLQSHGERDRVIPFELGKRLFEAANEPKEFFAIPGADHDDWASEAYWQQLGEFVTSAVGR